MLLRGPVLVAVRCGSRSAAGRAPVRVAFRCGSRSAAGRAPALVAFRCGSRSAAGRGSRCAAVRCDCSVRSTFPFFGALIFTEGLKQESET